MKTSSTKQLEFDYSSGTHGTRPDADSDPVEIGLSSGQSEESSSAPIRLPTFEQSSPAYAITARIAGRLNAASISEEEHKKLLATRQELLDKKFSGTITRQESNKLEYVRWSLDRIDDSRFGQSLDVLEGHVETYENFVKYLTVLQNHLEKQKKKK